MAMPSIGRKPFLLISIWISATLLFAMFATALGPSQMLFGLPWIVYLSIIAQVSFLILYIVIARTIWKVDKEEGSR